MCLRPILGRSWTWSLRSAASTKTTEYLDASRVILHFEIPLSEIIIDFYDKLKSVTQGYASLDYQFHDYRAGDLVKVEVLVNEDPVDALAMITHRDDAYHRGQRLVSRLKALIPRQMFTVPVQAAIGKRVISRANVKALRKDVLAKCYGGDVTRKRKLLEKTKEGQKAHENDWLGGSSAGSISWRCSASTNKASSDSIRWKPQPCSSVQHTPQAGQPPAGYPLSRQVWSACRSRIHGNVSAQRLKSPQRCPAPHRRFHQDPDS